MSVDSHTNCVVPVASSVLSVELGAERVGAECPFHTHGLFETVVCPNRGAVGIRE